MQGPLLTGYREQADPLQALHWPKERNICRRGDEPGAEKSPKRASAERARGGSAITFGAFEAAMRECPAPMMRSHPT
jgi:hypothetical protein